MRDVAGTIESLGADIVAVQEIRRHQAYELARHLGWSAPFWSFKHNGWYGLPRRAEGMAIIAKEPIEQRRTVAVSYRAPRWSYTRRIAQQAVIINLKVVNVHLASHDRTEERTAQARRLLVFAGESDVIAGDLNEELGGDAITLLVNAGYRPVEGDLANTSPSDAPVRRIDHVLTFGRVTIQHEEVPPSGAAMVRLSDHLPVAASLSIIDR
jgi:endonuclease/exonuclease/phosphatase family metal-dependent hydrolase